jgi:hypothetical protein
MSGGLTTSALQIFSTSISTVVGHTFFKEYWDSCCLMRLWMYSYTKTSLFTSIKLVATLIWSGGRVGSCVRLDFLAQLSTLHVRPIFCVSWNHFWKQLLTLWACQGTERLGKTRVMTQHHWNQGSLSNHSASQMLRSWWVLAIYNVSKLMSLKEFCRQSMLRFLTIVLSFYTNSVPL